MEKVQKSMRRIVSLALLLALLIGVMPLLKIATGFADDSKPISVRINGFAQTDANGIIDAMKKSGQTGISTIEVISGVITEADFRDIKAQRLHTNLQSITMNTIQVPAITDATVFAGYPSTCSIHVMSSVVAQFKNAPDGDISDNLWYGLNIVDAGVGAPSPGVDKKEISNVEIDVESPLVGNMPKDVAVSDASSKYSVSHTIWSNETSAVSKAFEAGKKYKTTVALKAAAGYYFSASAKPVIFNKTAYVVSDKKFTPQLGSVRVSTETTTNDTMLVELTYTEDGGTLGLTNPTPRAGVISNDFIVNFSCIIDTEIQRNATVTKAVSGLVECTQANNVKWYKGTVGSLGSQLSSPITPADGSDFVAEITLTADAGFSFDPAIATVNHVGMVSAGFTRGAASNITVSADGSKLTFQVPFTRAPSDITLPPVNLELSSPMGAENPEDATTSDGGYAITTTKWYDGTDEITTTFPATPAPDKSFSAVVVLTPNAGSVFSAGHAVSIVDSNTFPTKLYRHKMPRVVRNADGTLTVTVEYEINTGAHIHDNFVFDGPPITDTEGHTTNIIDSIEGGTVIIKLNSIKCVTCGMEITADCALEWYKLYEKPGEASRYELVEGDRYAVSDGGKVLTITGVNKNDVEPKYVVRASNGNYTQNSPYVIIYLGDSSMPDPYFDPTLVQCDLGDNVTLKVLSGLPDPQPTTLKYEWRKGALPADGSLPTGNVIGNNSPEYTIRDAKVTDDGFYNVTVKNEKNGKARAAQVQLKTKIAVDDLIPIEAKDIFALELIAPKTGDSPVFLKAPDDANYTIQHSWRSSTSTLSSTSKFEASRSYIADIRFTPKNGYRMGKVGESHLEIDVNTPHLSKTFKEMGENGKYCRIEVKFSTTMNPNKADQAQLQFVLSIPEKKTYGDTDFALSVRGGSGDGAITFKSSDENVFEIINVSGGDAVIRVIGSGTATITATKAGGKDATNNYNPATAVTSKITVEPKILVVKAADKTIKADTSTEIFPVEISGFVKGDNEFTLSGFETPTAKASIPETPEAETTTTGKKKNEPVKTPEQLLAEEEARLNKLCGKFEIIPSGGKSTPAYVFRYVTGTLTINRTGTADAPSPYENFIRSNSPTIEDRKNGVLLTEFSPRGYFDAGTQLVVENLTYKLTDEEKALYNANINASVGGKQLAQLYDITLKRDGYPVQPNGDVLVDIDLASSLKGRYTDLQIAYISDYGDVLVMPHALNYDKATFLTDHFSKYAVIGVPRYGIASGNTSGTGSGNANGSDVPQTSDGNPLLPLFIGLSVISSATIFKLKREKKLG